MLPSLLSAPKVLYDGKLNIRLREIAICRQAYKAKSAYELHQHGLLAKANGVTEEEIKAITSEEPVNSLDDEANFICHVADELEKEATLSKKTYHGQKENLFLLYPSVGKKKEPEVF